MRKQNTFFQWQHKQLNWLLGWGTASVVAGVAMLGSKQTAAQQFGIQALTWGAIDAAIAVFGRRGARQKLRQQLDDATVEREQRRFTWIVAANAGLDVLYMICGGWLARQADERRRGMGLGIIVQGLFLFLFDSFLTWRLLRWRDDNETKS